MAVPADLGFAKAYPIRRLVARSRPGLAAGSWTANSVSFVRAILGGTIDMFNPVYERSRQLLRCGAILLLALVVGSCGSNEPKPSTGDTITNGFLELRMEAQKVITDSVRRDKYLAGTTSLETVLNEFDETSSKTFAEYRAAFVDYGTDKAKLSDIAARFRAEQSQANARFIEAHLAMASSVTADEWKALAKKEVKLLKGIKKAAAGSLE
jgi:hypothetical protein